MSDDRFMLTTTQAAVEETLGRFRNGQKSVFDLAVKPPRGAPTVLGIGFGGTFATALDSAQQAFQVSAQSGEPAIVREAGTVDGSSATTVPRSACRRPPTRCSSSPSRPGSARSRCAV